MKNYVQEGDVITVPAPYAVTSGQGVLIGSLFGVAGCDAASGANVEIVPEGVFDITANVADVATAGTKAYWDNVNRRITTPAAGNQLVGALTLAKGGSDTTARVFLDGAVR
jgi:predicted RecA/RadA family phage recombinase